MVHPASKITWCDLPPLAEIYNARLQRTGLKVLKDSHPADGLSNYPEAVHLFNILDFPLEDTGIVPLMCMQSKRV